MKTVSRTGLVGHRKQQERTGTAYYRQPWQPAGKDEDTARYGLPAVQGSHRHQRSESTVPGRKRADQMAAVSDGFRRMGYVYCGNINTNIDCI